MTRSNWHWLKAALGITCLLSAGLPCCAQWQTQTTTLNPGWNAIFVQVQPEPRGSDPVFSGLPIESVWMWNRRAAPLQFIQDPSTLKPTDPDWLVYFPAGAPLASQSTLGAVIANHGYLIKIIGSQPVALKLQGTPFLRVVPWIPDSLNLAGFRISQTTPPTFASFFSGSAAHQSMPIFRLSPGGAWQPLDASTQGMKNGEAFWIQTKGGSTFAGSIVVQLQQGDRLDFGRSLVEQTITVKNSSASPLSLQLVQHPSESPPSGVSVALAGNVALSYFQNDPARGQFGWIPLSGPLALGQFAPGQERKLRLSVRRTDFAPFALPAGATDAAYQALLEVTDASGSASQFIPVTAQPGTGFLQKTLAHSAMRTASTTPHPKAGLWIGSAVINQVSQPANPTDPDAPRPTPSELQFRILIHVDSDGQARLLQEVFLMTKDGSPVLVTDEAKLSQFSGATLRDGQQVGRRFSTVAFGFNSPQLMSGNFGNFTTPLTCSVALGYDDPVNPFKHRFHPDHNNLSANYREVLPEGVQSFTFTRQLGLTFTPTDPQGPSLVDFGDKYTAGIYTETLTGVNQHRIQILGFFRLSRVSTVGVLNDGL